MHLQTSDGQGRYHVTGFFAHPDCTFSGQDSKHCWSAASNSEAHLTLYFYKKSFGNALSPPKFVQLQQTHAQCSALLVETFSSKVL
jgi:hypothetical protein